MWTKKTVAVIGLPPSVAGVDRFPGITAETLNLARAVDTASLAQAGFAVDFSCIDVRTLPVEGVHGRLAATHCDDTVIGAGVRTDTDRFALFEQRVNLVHEKRHPPGSASTRNPATRRTASAAGCDDGPGMSGSAESTLG